MDLIFFIFVDWSLCRENLFCCLFVFCVFISTKVKKKSKEKKTNDRRSEENKNWVMRYGIDEQKRKVCANEGWICFQLYLMGCHWNLLLIFLNVLEMHSKEINKKYTQKLNSLSAYYHWYFSFDCLFIFCATTNRHKSEEKVIGCEWKWWREEKKEGERESARVRAREWAKKRPIGLNPYYYQCLPVNWLTDMH